MKKKLALALSIVGVIAAGKSLINTRQTEVPDFIQKAPKKFGMRTLNAETSGPDIQQDMQWDDFKNYNLSTEDLLKKTSDHKALAQYARQVALKMNTCLKKDLCGHTPDGAYFNPTKTPSHALLERSLEIMMALKENGLNNVLNKDQLLSMMELKNDKIQTLSLSLIIDQGLSEEGYSKVLAHLPELEPEAIGSAYKMLQDDSGQSNVNRDQYLISLKNSFQQEDPLRVIELAKSLKYLNVDQNDLFDIARASCTHQNESHNFKAIMHFIHEKAKLFNLNLSDICN